MASNAESLIKAWVDMSFRIRENRFLKGLSFNEMAICAVLTAHGEGMTAADLCRETRLLKSQMNKELARLEEHGLIERSVDEADRRKVIVRYVPTPGNAYEVEHARAIGLFSGICEKLGPTDAATLIALLERATDAADDLIEREKD